MPIAIRRRRPAMGTLFEAILVGDDAEQLGALADAALDEVERVDRLLSRFDPRSEVARINREAGAGPVLVDYEFLEVLLLCRDAWSWTDGAFDITATSRAGTFADVAIDAGSRTVRLGRPGLAIDLGGIGKGVALDRASAKLRALGAGSAMLHGGTSSVVAIGRDETGRDWRIGVRDPFAAPEVAPELFALRLKDRALSCSAATVAGQPESDLIDPGRRAPIEENAACVVLGPTASEAEVLSTAMLCRGRARAGELAARCAWREDRAIWIERRDGRNAWDWLRG